MEYRCHAETEQSADPQIGADEGHGAVEEPDLIQWALKTYFPEDLHDDGALTLGAFPVGFSHHAQPAVVRDLFGGHGVPSGMEVPSGIADPGVRVPLALPVVPGGAVEPVRLLLGQLQIQSAQPVDEGDETEEVHFHVGVHGDTEILLDRVIQQFHAAGGIGEIQRSVPASGHGKEHVPHQGSQTDGSAFFLYAAEDHGVAAHLGFLALAPVLPDEEDIDDLAAFDAGNGIQSPVDVITGTLEGIQRTGVKIAPGIPVHAAQFIDG